MIYFAITFCLLLFSFVPYSTTFSVIPLCDKKSFFKPILVNDLHCGAFKYTKTEVADIELITTKNRYVSVPVCECYTKHVFQHCYTQFFGSRDRWDTTEHRRSTIEGCRRACIQLWREGSDLVSVEFSPGLCSWLQTSTTERSSEEAILHTGSMDSILGVIHFAGFAGGTCRPENGFCGYEGEKAFFVSSNTVSEHCHLAGKKHKANVREVGKLGYEIIVPDSHIAARISQPCYQNLCNKKVVFSDNGVLFDQESLPNGIGSQPCYSTELPTHMSHLPTHIIFEGLVMEEWVNLMRKEMCELTKVVIHEMLIRNAPIPTHMLISLYNPTTLHPVYRYSKGKLYSRLCNAVIVKEYLAVCPGVWTFTTEGKKYFVDSARDYAVSVMPTCKIEEGSGTLPGGFTIVQGANGKRSALKTLFSHIDLVSDFKDDLEEEESMHQMLLENQEHPHRNFHMSSSVVRKYNATKMANIGSLNLWSAMIKSPFRSFITGFLVVFFLVLGGYLIIKLALSLKNKRSRIHIHSTSIPLMTRSSHNQTSSPSNLDRSYSRGPL